MHSRTPAHGSAPLMIRLLVQRYSALSVLDSCTELLCLCFRIDSHGLLPFSCAGCAGVDEPGVIYRNPDMAQLFRHQAVSIALPLRRKRPGQEIDEFCTADCDAIFAR